MILTDYLRSDYDATWDIAKQCGVTSGVIRLPEDDKFDFKDFSHWKNLYKKFTDFGITPILLEPMPDKLHNHIKIGDKKRDWAIEQVIAMLPIMDKLNIRTICFNFMAHLGWLRTNNKISARGGAFTTGFNITDFKFGDECISENELWDNYTYFINAVIPYAEKYGIKLALHPDDPPIERLGNISRIMTSYNNIKHAVYDILPSDNLGVTMCQATFYMMGENLYEIIPKLKEKIFFIHFRNATGNKFNFRETFHDNGDIDMVNIMKMYADCGIDVPIRVDHVPLLKGEEQRIAGYSALGRLYAIGYLKGIIESVNNFKEFHL